MRDTVRRFIERHELIHQGAVIVVGVSGGPDSLALLDFLHGEKGRLGIELVAAHVDHMFRGEESLRDLRFVGKFCQGKAIRFEGKRIDVPEYQKRYHLNAQEAARECRYHFFEEVMRKYQADYLALAHHGDDQVETMLMRMMRGSYGESLAGIQAKRVFATGHIIRPFLPVTKSDIISFCKERGLQPRIDPSNEKDIYTRNRFRSHVLPFLKKENPRVHERFQHMSEMLTEDDRYLMQLAEKEMDRMTEKEAAEGNEIRLDRIEFLTKPMPLQRRVIHLILNYLYQTTPSSISSVHIESVLRLLGNEHPSGTLDFPRGLRIIRSYDECFFRFGKKEKVEYKIIFDPPGKVELDDGWMITGDIYESYSGGYEDAGSFVIPMEGIRLPLTVRTRVAGDRMSIKGMTGTKKVKDIFIDQKIPATQRESWPIIADSSGKILWLPFLKRSAVADRDNGEGPYLILQCIQERSSRRGNSHEE